MRIALITPEYVTENNFDGGLANYVHRAAVALRNAGHEVEIFTSSHSNGRILHKEIVVHRVNHDTFFHRFLKRVTGDRLATTMHILFRSYYLARRFLAVHHQNGFNIVQASSFWAPGLFIKEPLVTRISSFEPILREVSGIPYRFDNAVAEWLELVQMRRSKAVYAPSRFLAQAVRKFQSLQVDVVPPPFTPPEIKDDDSICRSKLGNLRYLLFFGSICKLKGIEVVWRNLPIIFSDNSDIHFVFVGKGELPPLSEDLMPFRERIHALGPMRHENLFPIIRNSTAVVLPSIFDNLPNACLESMFLEKVVIGTRGASFDEMIDDGVTGYLFDHDDQTGFRMAVSRVCQSSEGELAAVGRRAKLSILKNFDAESRIQELVQYASNALSNNGGRS